MGEEGGEALEVVVEAGEFGGFVAGEEFGGVGGGGGADVSGEVGEAEVDFVANAGDDGDFAAGDFAG